MIRGVLAGTAALLAVPVLVAAVGTTVVPAAFPSAAAGASGVPSTAAASDIPPDYLRLYMRAAAATCPGLDWAVLAAVGKVETDHGRSRLPGVTRGENYAGAGGPMQFLAPTFTAVTAAHPPPPGGARPPSRYNTHDAIHTAAAYLCDSGAPTRLDDALFAYNHSRAYVADVLARSATYRNTLPNAGTSTGGQAGRVAVEYAREQLGLPYLWGGDGPARGEAGFDCSGLTTAAYTAAGVTLPRTAHTQYRAGPLLPPGEPLRAGDLLFFGTPARVHHVGIATGDGTMMIHAPRRGTTVRIQDSHDLHDFLAASRPSHRQAT